MRLTRSQRRRQALAFNRLRVTTERRMAAALRREIQQAGAEAAAAYPSWKPAITAHAKRLASLLAAEGQRAALAGADHATDGIGKAHPTWERKLDTAEELRARIVKWAKRNAAKAMDIARTTERTIRRVITAGLDDELHPRQIATAIRDRVSSMSVSRSETIARTEAGAALGYGEHQSMTAAADDLGLKTVKVWTATEDDRTRETHLDADGQRRDLDEPFIVGGAELMFPSDPDGPPGEVINCRCVCVYESE